MASDSSPLPNFFRDQVYQDAKAKGKPVPWDISKHQPALDSYQSVFFGKVIDIGCGLGDNARWVASFDHVESVTAMDLSEDAISQASSRGDSNGKVKFQVGDLFEVEGLRDTFDTLLDSAVFHCIGNDDVQRKYLEVVSSWIKPGGRLVLHVFSDRNKDPWMGPRRISPAHAVTLWTEAGWIVDSLDNQVYFEDTMGRNEGRGGHALIMIATKK
jgi:SAM-dependent methyltransferase